MRKRLLIVLAILLALSPVAYASELYDQGNITGYDFADIIINGELGLEKDKGYVREDDGFLLPSTINWNGTTYVPLKKLSELLGANIRWNGSILIDLDKGGTNNTASDFLKITKTKIDMPYTNEMIFKIQDGKTAYVEDVNGVIVQDLDISLNSGQSIVIRNPYFLDLEKNFTLTVVKDNEIVEQPFKVGDISLESFDDMHGRWYTVLPANEAAGFYHPTLIGFSRYTDDIKKDFNMLQNTLIVEGSNEGVSLYNKDSYRKQIEERFAGELSVTIAQRNKFPFMVSMFPRPLQDGFFYSHALDRDTLFNTKSYYDELGRGNLYRMDEQFIAMIDYSQEKLEKLGLTVDDKVAIAGFSASSDWATRLTMLYPEKIKYVLANIPSTMPMTSFEGMNLLYPLGMSDIHTITGKSFDFEAYKTVPQFWFVGGADNGDGTRYDDGWGNYGNRSNDWNQEGIDYRRIFGDDSIKRRAYQMELIDHIGLDNIDYISYPGLPHDWGSTQLNDIDKFIQRVK